MALLLEPTTAGFTTPSALADWNSARVIFLGFAILTVLGALSTIMRKNDVAAVMSLVATFFGLAAVYTFLSAHFIAALQVLVYAGAIMVLFIFVIMLLDLKEEQRRRIKFFGLFAGLLSVGIVFSIFIKSLLAAKLTAEPPANAHDGETYALGTLLFSQYTLPFEVVSVLLLVAMIGVILLSKKKLE